MPRQFVNRSWLLPAVVLITFPAIAPAQPEPHPAPPPPRSIPALTAPDMFPRGCVDCHVDRPDLKLDARLSTLLTASRETVRPELLEAAQACAPAGLKLAGKHPDVSDALADVPRSCLECHGRDAREAPAFARLVHRIHLTGGERNHYLTLFQGECTHCHKLDATTGAWSLPSGAEK